MASLTVIDSVSGPMVDTQFVETTTKRLGVTEVSECQSIQSDSDPNTGATISETVNPLTKRGTSVNGLIFQDVLWFSLRHERNVAHRLQSCNQSWRHRRVMRTDNIGCSR